MNEILKMIQDAYDAIVALKKDLEAKVEHANVILETQNKQADELRILAQQLSDRENAVKKIEDVEALSTKTAGDKAEIDAAKQEHQKEIKAFVDYREKTTAELKEAQAAIAVARETIADGFKEIEKQKAKLEEDRVSMKQDLADQILGNKK